MHDLTLRGASVLRPGGWHDGDLVVRDGRVAHDAAPGAVELEATGRRAVPGFIDLQCNGGAGIDLAREPERLWELATQLPAAGVTAWLPTIVTSPPGVVERALAALAAGPPAGWTGAIPLGLHLEGPFLAERTRGAHQRELLQLPSLEAVEGWSRAAGVAVVTMAPELPGALDVIAALVERGVVVSVGHSAASAAEVRAAVDAGARWVTHLHNGMVPLHHREPGVVGVALADDRLHVGLIADGVHVDPLVVAIDQRALGSRLTLVTDAVGATADDGDAVRLGDGTLAGTELGMDQVVRNLIEFAGCPEEVAVHAGSTAPARLLGDAERGVLEPGARADIALLGPGLDVVATVVGAEVVYDRRPR